MDVNITDIRVIEESEYYAAGEPPKVQEFVKHLYEQVQDAIQDRIKRAVRGTDFFPTQILIDWETGEISTTASVHLTLKFVRTENGIEITELAPAY